MNFNRVFAMPNSETFSIKPIESFVQKYLAASSVSIDPFARNKTWATHTNDLNPNTSAAHHMDAEDFLKKLKADGVKADLVLFDPPYSPRQISECYKSIGLKVGKKETQNGHFYKRVRDALDALIKPGGVVLSFGWQSAGMGITRNYRMLDILLVNHGGGHNDTICIAEQKITQSPILISTTKPANPLTVDMEDNRMKPSITLNFDTVAQLKLFVDMLEAVERGNASVVSPLPAGPPVPEPIAPKPAPMPAPVPGPSPMPPPPPQSGNGSSAVTIQQVMGAMSEYAKLHKAAGVKNVLSHCGLSKVTEANPEQLIWLKGVFDLGQPMAAPGA